MVCEPLTANALEPDHETGLKPRAIAARRRHSASMRPAPITADKHCSLRFAYAVGNPIKVNPINSVMVGAERREEAEQQRALLGIVANALSLCTMHA